MTSFLDIEIKRDRQTVLGRKSTLNSSLICDLVLLGGAGKDEFFTLTFTDLQAYFTRHYKGRKRPHTIPSLHCAVQPKDLHKFKIWNVLFEALKGSKQKLARERKPKRP